MSRIPVNTKKLEQFTINLLQKYGVNEEDARITADVLLCADKRGIESHGVARLKRYIDGIANKTILINTENKILKETPVSLVVDGQDGMGQPITYKTMKKCIEKAKQGFMCFATIRNSNHYGIAGYYSLMALEENMIGFSVTNSAPLVVPTFGKDAIIGTNPISLGVPAKSHDPFLLDMATSTVPRGKLEVYSRAEKPIPESWATDENGTPTVNATLVLDNLINRRGGGLLPLGGGVELTGGHKGYGLSALVDILSGVLSGGAVGSDVYGQKGQPANVCHFIGAINPEAFIGLDELEKNMDYYIDMLKNSPKADSEHEIYVAGEKEYRSMRDSEETVTLQPKVFEILNAMGNEYNLSLATAE